MVKKFAPEHCGLRRLNTADHSGFVPTPNDGVLLHPMKQPTHPRLNLLVTPIEDGKTTTPASKEPNTNNVLWVDRGRPVRKFQQPHYDEDTIFQAITPDSGRLGNVGRLKIEKLYLR
jgi:hypothetical protein